MEREKIEKEVNSALSANLKQCMDSAVQQLSAEAVAGCEQIARVAKECVAGEFQKLDQNDIFAPRTAGDIKSRCKLDEPQR